MKIKSELIILFSTLIHFRGQGLKGGLIKNDVIVLFTKRGRCREYFRETKWRSVETNGRRDSEVGRLPEQKQLFFNTVSSLHQRKLSAKSLFSPGIMDSLSETFISRLGLRREFNFLFLFKRRSFSQPDPDLWFYLSNFQLVLKFNGRDEKTKNKNKKRMIAHTSGFQSGGRAPLVAQSWYRGTNIFCKVQGTFETIAMNGRRGGGCCRKSLGTFSLV